MRFGIGLRERSHRQASELTPLSAILARLLIESGLDARLLASPMATVMWAER